MDYACSICGSTVSRRQSISVGDGKRACRAHQEAIETSQRLQANEAQRKHENQRKQKEKYRGNHENLVPTIIKPRCWICHKDGMRQDEYYTRALIDLEKRQLDPQYVSQLNKEECLYFVDWSGTNTKVRLPYNVFQMVEAAKAMFGTAMLLICKPCCAEKGFETVVDRKLKNLNIDDLMASSIAYETFVKPAILDIAQKDL